jgi:hypothetical protein
LFLLKSGAKLGVFAQIPKKCAKIVSFETIFVCILSADKE